MDEVGVGDNDATELLDYSPPTSRPCAAAKADMGVLADPAANLAAIVKDGVVVKNTT